MNDLVFQLKHCLSVPERFSLSVSFIHDFHYCITNLIILNIIKLEESNTYQINKHLLNK